MEHLSLYPSIRVQAEYSPEAPAILAPNREPLTYRRLQQHLESVVVQLNSFGIGRNDPIAIVLPNGPEMATAFLAVASCATSAPLNPAYREPEFEFYLSDLNAKALMVLAGLDSPVVTVAQAYDIPIIELTPVFEESAGIFTLSGKQVLTYWKRQLAGAPPVLNLPTDHPRPAIPEYQGGSYTFHVPSKLFQGLNTLSQQENVTLFMTVLATFNVLIYRYTAQEDIVIGTPVAGRTQVETEVLIGCFVNTLALRSDLSGNPSFRELLQRTRIMALEAYSHQDLPFEKLVENLHPDRSLNRTPIFQTLFNLENVP